LRPLAPLASRAASGIQPLPRRRTTMKQPKIRFAAVLTLALAACGGSSAQALADESISTMESLNATLDTVKDEASAKAALPKLEKLAATMKDLETKMSKAEPPSESDQKAMMGHQARVMEQRNKLQANMMRIAMDEKLNVIVGPAIEKMGK
jgi:hypothetical protein